MRRRFQRTMVKERKIESHGGTALHASIALVCLCAACSQIIGCGCVASRDHQRATSPSTAAAGASSDSGKSNQASSALQVGQNANDEGARDSALTASSTVSQVLAAATRVIYDPRLAQVREQRNSGNFAAAAALMQHAIEQHSPQRVTRLRWLFTLATLYNEAKMPSEAARVLQQIGEDRSWVLRDYALVQAAEVPVSEANYELAYTLASGVAEGLPVSRRARLMQATALDGMQKSAEAMAIYVQLLRDEKSDAVWQTSAIRYANALLGAPVDERDEAALVQALAWIRKVLVESSLVSNLQQAGAAEARLFAAISPAKRTAWTAQMRYQRAETLANRGRRNEALAQLGALSNDLETGAEPGGALSEWACASQVLEGKLLGLSKATRARSGKAYDRAIATCKSHPSRLVSALYAAARIKAQLGSAAAAIALYDRVEKEFPNHRLADDARWRSAKTAAMMKNDALFETKLKLMAADYPEGDMLEDGLFDLALSYMNQGAWQKAMEPLQTSVRLRPKEKLHHSAGRALYFLGKCLDETGDKTQAVEAWTKVIIDNPLSYYTRLALSRLHANEPSSVVNLLPSPPLDADKSILSDADASKTLPDKLNQDGFRRAVELLALGMTQQARDEIKQLGLGSDDLDALRISALVYHHSDNSRIAFQVAQGRVGSWSSSYPQGKWLPWWTLAYPQLYLPIVKEKCQSVGVSPSTAYGIMREESAFDPGAVSSASAYGLMQLIVPTAKMVAKPLNINVTTTALSDPSTNVTLGCKLLESLTNAYPQCPALAVPSYNAGSGATHRWLENQQGGQFDLWVENIPYDETRGYTKRVLSTMGVYSYLYDGAKALQSLLLPLELPK